MTIHREGHIVLFILLIVLFGLNWAVFYFYPASVLAQNSAILASVIFYLLILQFFRNPIFAITQNTKHVLAPADGKVVVIEEVEETEYLRGKRKQISIFMSPVNVHVNRMPVAGQISFFKYHPGKYLVAWHPKSSTENERHSVVIKNNKAEILVKQIAGALAKRIINYLREGQMIEQSAEFGFIKFGSRVDILLPVGTKVNVKLNEVVKGGITVLATLE